jgi:hypothetical protein
MAVYKIFPEKSATLYSSYPLTNTGLDEVIEISTFKSATSTNESSRGIIKFSTSEIQDIIQNKVSGSNYSASLKLYLADASELPLDYTLYCYPISGSWNKGVGKLGNVPITTDGASWTYRDLNSGSKWIGGTSGSPSYPTNTTGSYSSYFGGGLWLSSPTYAFTQSFTEHTEKDININVTNAVSAWYNNTISNDGFIIKHNSNLEFTTSSKFELKYFSSTTHTIYPPCLEIKWNDFSYVTGSLSTVTNSNFSLVINNNKAEYQQDSIQRFRIAVRDVFPTIEYRTSINYSNTKALPSTSYWSIKDLDTEEIVVDYDTTFTKISCDSTGNYFDIYMNGLEPERYYKLLIKTILSTKETIVTDKDYIFKVIR